ncbi:MAG: hypothetical protein IIZ31_03110 [Lachnospiraceae bacterium]|nr:hypothetical protein [Lachnospiraceae bacterium]
MGEVKLEKIVQPFYEALEEGKIMGRKCPECGAVEFPPVYACNTCGCLHTDWYEISGNAKMHSIVMPAALSSKPDYKDMGKYAYGEIELEEGARFNGVVRGMTKKIRKKIMEEGLLPVDVHAAIYQQPSVDYKTVVFDLDEKYLQ